jgi:hypothetical protein
MHLDNIIAALSSFGHSAIDHGLFTHHSQYVQRGLARVTVQKDVGALVLK